MARSPLQSDFVVSREEEPAEPLPTATLRSNEASAGATKAVYIVMFIVLAALVILCAVGPHIPGGG